MLFGSSSDDEEKDNDDEREDDDDEEYDKYNVRYNEDTGDTRYDRYRGNDEHHTHEWLNTKTGSQGGHGENLSKEERRSHGRWLSGR